MGCNERDERGHEAVDEEEAKVPKERREPFLPLGPVG